MGSTAAPSTITGWPDRAIRPSSTIICDTSTGRNAAPGRCATTGCRAAGRCAGAEPAARGGHRCSVETGGAAAAAAGGHTAAATGERARDLAATPCGNSSHDDTADHTASCHTAATRGDCSDTGGRECACHPTSRDSAGRRSEAPAITGASTAARAGCATSAGSARDAAATRRRTAAGTRSVRTSRDR